CRSAGYVATGFTNSFTPGNDQLYLIKTDLGMKSGCNETQVEPNRVVPKYPVECPDPFSDLREHEEVPDIKSLCQNWGNLLCYDTDGTKPCFIPECDCGGGNRQQMQRGRLSLSNVGGRSSRKHMISNK